MNRSLIAFAIVLIAELAALIGCTNKPSPSPTINSTPWENVKVYSDPNVLISVPIDESFSIVVSYPFTLGINFWESSDPEAFEKIDIKDLQPISPSGSKIAYLFKSLKVGKYQIRFGVRSKSGIANQTTFEIEGIQPSANRIQNMFSCLSKI